MTTPEMIGWQRKVEKTLSVVCTWFDPVLRNPEGSDPVVDRVLNHGRIIQGQSPPIVVRGREEQRQETKLHPVVHTVVSAVGNGVRSSGQLEQGSERGTPTLHTFSGSGGTFDNSTWKPCVRFHFLKLYQQRHSNDKQTEDQHKNEKPQNVCDNDK